MSGLLINDIRDYQSLIFFRRILHSKLILMLANRYHIQQEAINAFKEYLIKQERKEVYVDELDKACNAFLAPLT